MILVCVLSYQRPHYLQTALRSFVDMNHELLGTELKMIALDQCAVPETQAVFGAFRDCFDTVFLTDRNFGIGWGFSQMVELSQLYEAEWLLFLEEDWMCKVPLVNHLERIYCMFEHDARIATLRLRNSNDPVAQVNHVTMQPVKTTIWDDVFLIGNYHYVFNPHLVKREIAYKLIPVKSEHHAQIQYQALDLLAAQLQDRMFIHIGEERAPGRISRLPKPIAVIPHSSLSDTRVFFVTLPVDRISPP